jgi:hypothetical protein
LENFRLPEGNFDAAIMMSETFPIMSENPALLGHLRAVAKTLRKGGLYCVDIDRQPGVEVVQGKRQLWRERSVQVGETRIEIKEYNRPIEWCSGLHSMYQIECKITFPGGSKVSTDDRIPVRYILPPTLELAALASGCFKLIACYADLSLTRPMRRCYGRWWGILQKL